MQVNISGRSLKAPEKQMVVSKVKRRLENEDVPKDRRPSTKTKTPSVGVGSCFLDSSVVSKIPAFRQALRVCDATEFLKLGI